MANVFVTHEVMFLLDRGEGQVLPTSDRKGYGEVSGVTVRLFNDPARVPQVSASIRRCRKDGSDDKRMGNVHTSVELPNKAEWIERARVEITDHIGSSSDTPENTPQGQA